MDEGRRDATAPVSPFIFRSGGNGRGGGDVIAEAAFGHMNQLIQMLNESNRVLTTRTETAENKVEELQRTIIELEQELEVLHETHLIN